MAVIDDIPGLEVTIVSNGGPLREYDDPEAHPSTKAATKYVEVVGDDTFEILAKFHDNYVATYGVRFQIPLDGNKVHSQLIRLKDLKTLRGHKVVGVKEKIRGRWHNSNFLFSSLAIEQGSARELDQDTEDRLQKTGTITVLFHLVKNLRWPRHSKKVVEEEGTKPHGIAKFGELPEHRVKELGLSHQGHVDEPVKKTKHSRHLSYRYVDGKDEEHACAVFHFKYRSLATLKDLGIAPRTPPPVSPFSPVLTTPPSTPPAPIVTAPAPAVHQPHERAVIHDNDDGLSKEELLTIIGTYRGHTNGLNALNMRSMLALLEHYQGLDEPVKGTKRGAEGTDSLHGDSKRLRGEVVVLDL